MRQMVRTSLLAVALALIATVAQASTIIQFTQLTFNTPVSLSENVGNSATHIQATNVPINVIFDPSFCLVLGCGGAGNGTYLLNLAADSQGAATSNGTDIVQNYNGTISITNGGFNLLTVNFSDLFSGSVGGGDPTMAASQPPDLFSGSSNVLDPLKLGQPRGFALSFSNLLNGLAINGTSIRSGTADVTGTFNATPAAVPEPATMLLLGTGIAGLVARRRRARQ